MHSSRLLPAQNSNQSRGLSVPPAFPCLTYSFPQTRSTHSLTPPSPALPLSLPWTKGADDPSKLIRSLPTPFFQKKKTAHKHPPPPRHHPCFPSPKKSLILEGNLLSFMTKKKNDCRETTGTVFYVFLHFHSVALYVCQSVTQTINTSLEVSLSGRRSDGCALLQ